jgi:hemoglobin
MKPIHIILSSLVLILALTATPSSAADPASIPSDGKPNTVCPVTGKPANAKITYNYEGMTFAFADDASRAKWKADRENSLYHKLGGKAAIDAAVEAFYVKVQADDRVKHFFEDINMSKQRRKQKEFLSAAFGGPVPWAGKDMRKAHASLKLEESHFNAIAENLKSTLEDLKIKKELVDQVMAIAGSVKDDVLNRPKTGK